MSKRTNNTRPTQASKEKVPSDLAGMDVSNGPKLKLITGAEEDPESVRPEFRSQLASKLANFCDQLDERIAKIKAS